MVPHIIPGEFDQNGSPKIKLLIEVTDGTFDKSPLSESTTPKTTTNTVNTEASIFEGQSLFIGGYFHENHSISSAGVPFLKDIPLLGYLFKRDTRNNDVVERIYIITPSIIPMNDSKRTKLKRFFTDGQLAGEPTLKPDEFILTHDYERPSFDNATFKPKKATLNWGNRFKKNDLQDDLDEEEDDIVLEKIKHRKRLKACRCR